MNQSNNHTANNHSITIDAPILSIISRKYLPEGFEMNTWEDVKPYYDELNNRELSSVEALEKWLLDRNELENYIAENVAWRYINYTRNTEDAEIRARYLFYINQIKPKISPFANLLDKKLIDCPFQNDLKDEGYKIYLRTTRNEIELYRDENIQLTVESEEKAQEYAEIQAAMTIEYEGRELTMQQAAKYLKSPDRKVRKEVYDKVIARRMQDTQRLDELFSELVKLRHQIALNAGFDNFRDYKFKLLGRFDYTIEQVYQFHESVKQEFVPLAEIIIDHKRKKLGLDVIRPYDIDAEPAGEEPLKPYEDSEDLIKKGIAIFGKLDKALGNYLNVMHEKGYLDLDSRKGKAPGGYNYPLDEIGIPFIFMNASGKFRDMVTMMHEGGHAVHSFLARGLPLSVFKHTPSEVSELASMSMELLSMGKWDIFFNNPKDLVRAQLEQLESIVDSLPWIATVDKFQNWIYTHPDHSIKERSDEWVKIFKEFHPDAIDWTGYEAAMASNWQKQLHIFEVPFYYIEYGIAQLGALAVWKNYKNNPELGLKKYLNALKLGYTRSVPEIYNEAGISFNFSLPYVKDIADFLKHELDLLETNIPELV